MVPCLIKALGLKARALRKKEKMFLSQAAGSKLPAEKHHRSSEFRCQLWWTAGLQCHNFQCHQGFNSHVLWPCWCWKRWSGLWLLEAPESVLTDGSRDRDISPSSEGVPFSEVWHLIIFPQSDLLLGFRGQFKKGFERSINVHFRVWHRNLLPSS